MSEEIMLRLAPFNYQRFVQDDTFQAIYGGCEANLAVSLAHFGNAVEFVTCLPENAIGDAACNTLRGYGVLTHNIFHGGNRLGIYFLEHGVNRKPVLWTDCLTIE